MRGTGPGLALGRLAVLAEGCGFLLLYVSGFAPGSGGRPLGGRGGTRYGGIADTTAPQAGVCAPIARAADRGRAAPSLSLPHAVRTTYSARSAAELRRPVPYAAASVVGCLRLAVMIDERPSRS